MACDWSILKMADSRLQECEGHFTPRRGVRYDSTSQSIVPPAGSNQGPPDYLTDEGLRLTP